MLLNSLLSRIFAVLATMFPLNVRGETANKPDQLQLQSRLMTGQSVLYLID